MNTYNDALYQGHRMMWEKVAARAHLKDSRLLLVMTGLRGVGLVVALPQLMTWFDLDPAYVAEVYEISPRDVSISPVTDGTADETLTYIYLRELVS